MIDGEGFNWCVCACTRACVCVCVCTQRCEDFANGCFGIQKQHDVPTDKMDKTHPPWGFWGNWSLCVCVKVNPKILFSRFCYDPPCVNVCIQAVRRFWTGSSRSRLSQGEPLTSAFTKAADWWGFCAQLLNVRQCVWVWLRLRKRWKPKAEDNFVSAYVHAFHVGDCASVWCVGVSASWDTSHRRCFNWQPNQFILIHSFVCVVWLFQTLPE